MRLPMASMLESFVSQLLADYLSNYVQGIHPEQLRLGLWNGVAQLENVELRLEAFDYLQLPFAFRKGIVGKLKIQVPWKKLGWEPILIRLEDVFICVCPRDEFEWKIEALEARSLAAKKAKLAAAELAKLSARISQSVPEDNSSQSFLSYLSTKVIDNVQVTAENVHFQYVEQKIDSKVAFSFGITFSSFTMNTDQTSSGMPTGKLKISSLNKLLEIKGLAVYWNSDGETENSSSGLSFGLNTWDERVYLVHPFDLSIRLLMNRGSLDAAAPQYSVAIEANSLVFNLEDKKLHEMLILWDGLTISQMREKYGRFRPAVGQYGYNRKESGWEKVWWQYAVQAILVDVRKHLRRSSWSYLGWRINMRRKYVSLYQSKLDCLHKGKPAADQSLAELEELENELDVEEILSFRSAAESSLQLQSSAENVQDYSASESLGTSHKEALSQRKPDDQSSQKQRSWLNFLSLGMLGAAGSATASRQFAGVIPDEIIEDIYEATEYNPSGLIGHKELPKGYCRVVVTIWIGEAKVTLRGIESKRDIATLELEGIDVKIKLWQQSTHFCTTVNFFKAVDLYEKSSAFPVVLGSQDSILSFFNTAKNRKSTYAEVLSGASQHAKNSTYNMLFSDSGSKLTSSSMGPFLRIEIETLSHTEDIDMVIKIMTQPLQFVYSANLMKQIGSFMDRPASLETLKEQIFSSLNKLQSPQIRLQSKAELAVAMGRRISMEIQIDSPVLIFPQNLEDTFGSQLIVAMRTAILKSLKESNSTFLEDCKKLRWSHKENMEIPNIWWPKSASARGADIYEETLYSTFYNQFQFQLNDVQVLLAPHAYDWMQFRKDVDDGHNLYLAKHFDIDGVLAICTMSDEPTLTRFKLGGSLADVNIYLSSGKWALLRSIFSGDAEENAREEMDVSFGSRVDKFEHSNSNAAKQALNMQCSSAHQISGAEVFHLTLISRALCFSWDDEAETVILAADGFPLLARGGTALLMYTVGDFQEELHFEAESIHIEKVWEHLPGSPSLSMHSSSHLSVSGTLMPDTVWKWKWVASQADILLKSLQNSIELYALATVENMELTGLFRTNSLEDIRCKAMHLNIYCGKSCFKHHHCSSGCSLCASTHFCVVCMLRKQCCSNILVCAPESVHSGLEMNIAFGTGKTKHVFISIPFVKVNLYLATWGAITDIMQGALMHTSSKNDIVQDDADSANQLNFERSSTDEEFTKYVDGDTIVFQSSMICATIAVPNYDEVHSVMHMRDVLNSSATRGGCPAINASMLDADKYKVEKYVSCKVNFQVDNLLCRNSVCNIEASIVAMDINLTDSHNGSLHCLPLIQIADMQVKGCIDLKIVGRDYVNIVGSSLVRRADVWCSHAILCFLRSFKFQQSNPSGSSLDIGVSLTTNIQRASALLTDGRWNCNAPIFELRTKNIGIQTLWRHDDRLEFSSVMDLEAYYHNLEKVAWESVLEPWTFSCNLNNLFGPSSRHHRSKLSVTSSSQLNINLTNALLQAISRAWNLYHDASENFNNEQKTPMMKDKQISYAPYWLQNDTGIAITYWLCCGVELEDADWLLEGGESSGTSKSIVQPGCSIPLYFEEPPEQMFRKGRINSSSEKLADKRHLNGHHRMICIQLEGTSTASVPLSMDLVGTQFFFVTFSHPYGVSLEMKRRKERQVLEGTNLDNGKLDDQEHAFRTPVVFEVSCQHNSKIIRVYSTVSLVNATSVPMEVRFDIPFGLLPKVIEPIQPGMSMPLPVHLAETGQIRWKPLGNSHSWCEPQSLSQILLTASRVANLRSFVCNPAHHSNSPFRCCVMVEENSNPTLSSSVVDSNLSTNISEGNRISSQSIKHVKEEFTRFHEGANPVGVLREVTLHAPFIFKNCLPLPLSLRIESAAGLCLILHAPEGDSIFVFEVNTSHDLTLSISVPGFLSAHFKLASALASLELEKESPINHIVSLETLELLPLSPEGGVVYSTVEKLSNLVCGAREVSISVPFWVYNCSGMCLGLADTDTIDSPSAEKQVIELVITSHAATGQEDQKHQTESFGLQEALHNPSGGSTRIYAHGQFCGTAAMRSLGGKNIISCEPGSLISRKLGSGCMEQQYPKAHMYSPFKDDELNDKRMRLRVIPSHPWKGLSHGKASEARWSRPFPLNSPGGMTTVVVPKLEGEGALILSVVSASTLGACAEKTRTITFRPRFVLANTCDNNLFYKQQGTDTFTFLLKGEQAHLHWSDVSKPLHVSVRFDQHGWDWSGGFVPDQLGDTQLKVRNVFTGGTQMLRVEVQNALVSKGDGDGITGSDDSLGTYLILLSDDQSGFMPYRIDNFSLERLRFYQINCPNFESVLLPYSSSLYSWDEPWRPHQLVLEIPGEGVLGTYDLDEIQAYPPVQVHLSRQKSEREFLVSVHAEGPARVLTFQDINMHPNKDHNRSTLDIYANAQDEKIADIQCSDEMTFSFISVGLSFVDSLPQEVFFACAKGVALQILQDTDQQKFQLNVSYIQLDNQLRHAQYPVMISTGVPVASASFLTEGSDEMVKQTLSHAMTPVNHSALTIEIAKWRHLTNTVDCYQNINVRMAQVQLQLDEHIICYLSDLVRGWTETGHFVVDQVVSGSGNLVRFPSIYSSSSRTRRYSFLMDSESDGLYFVKVLNWKELFKSWPSPRAVKCLQMDDLKLFLLDRGGRKVYIETLHIAPVEVIVSFSSATWMLKHGTIEQPLLWKTGTPIQRGLMALVDVEGAPFQLRQLSLAHPLARWHAIKGMIIRHYTRQLLHEVYKIVGSVGFLGNPMGFMRSLGSGVKDFVSTPAKSLFQSPKQVIEGVAQGTQSLLSNTVFAISNAATLMSRAARKGVTAFDLNNDYTSEMKRDQQEYRFQEYGVLSELFEGLTGLLQSPVRGAEQHGIPGILSGVAVGAVGLVVKPAASILEVAGRTAQSIRSWSQPIQQVKRMRPPRHLSRDFPLAPYSWEEAIGNAVLIEAAGCHLKNEVYVTCRPMVDVGKYLLLTDNLLLEITSALVHGHASWLGPEWTIASEIALEDILHIERVGNTLNFLMGFPQRPSITKGSIKKNQVPTSGPFLHKSFEMAQSIDAEEIASYVTYIIDKHMRVGSRIWSGRKHIRTH